MIPYIDPEIIKYLEEIYPDKCPDLSMEEKLIWFSAGQVSVCLLYTSPSPRDS